MAGDNEHRKNYKPKKAMFLAIIKCKFISGNNGYLNFDYQNVLSVLGMEN